MKMEHPLEATAFSHPRTGQVNIGKWLGEAFSLLGAHFWELTLLTFVYLMVLFVASWFYWGFFVIYGPLTVGYFHILFNLVRGRPFVLGEITEGFRFFLQALLAHILTLALIGIGLALLVIPGLVAMAAYVFVYPILLEKREDFWTAMEMSRKMAFGHIFEMIAFVLVQMILFGLGMLFFGIGILWAIPLIYGSIVFAYRDLFGLEEAMNQ